MSSACSTASWRSPGSAPLFRLYGSGRGELRRVAGAPESAFGGAEVVHDGGLEPEVDADVHRGRERRPVEIRAAVRVSGLGEVRPVALDEIARRLGLRVEREERRG